MVSEKSAPVRHAEIGYVPSDWTVAPLSAFVSLVTYGFTNPMPTTIDGPYMVTAKDIHGGRIDYSTARHTSWEAYHNELTEKSRPRVNDILLTKDGSIGRVAICDRQDTCINQSVALIRPNNRTTSRFLKCLLESPHYQQRMEADSDGTTIRHIYITRVDKMEVAVPPLNEQQAIAYILGTLDDKIELNRRMNETLEAIARAFFESWFVDFDPVRAKVEGRGSFLRKPLADLFPDFFEDSELGEIPKGWEVRASEWLAERIAMGPFGSSIKVSTFVPDGIPVISGQHLHGTLLDDSEFNFVTEEHAEQLKRSNVQRGDVIFTHAGNIGQVAYIPETSRYERYVISQRQFYLRCDPTKMSPLFVVAYFKTHEGQHRLLANTSSTGVPSISQPVSYLRRLQLLVPDRDVLNLYDSIARSIYLRVAKNTNESGTLETVRDTLLPRLISGERRVKGVNRVLATSDL